MPDSSRHEHNDRSGTAYLEGEGELEIELRDLSSFDYNLQTAPGFPAGSNSQDNDEINLRIERVIGGGNFFSRGRSGAWIAIVRWNVTVPYILNYIAD
jgi:hypothetical protein